MRPHLARLMVTVAVLVPAVPARADDVSVCRKAFQGSVPFRKGIDACTGVLQRDPRAAFAYAGRAHSRDYGVRRPFTAARAAEIRRAFDAALADYTKAIAFDPSNSQYLVARGLLRQTRFEAFKDAAELRHAIADFSRGIELWPREAPVFLGHRARIYEALGERRKAIADFRAILAIDPKDYPSRDALKRLGARP
ncbi:MAG: tetratricopeptide repeat protein [Hyphomicrobiaceae bacterium]